MSQPSEDTRPTPRRAAVILRNLARMRVAVVGDLIADVYVSATPTRLSREAPVIVARWRGERLIPGGAANAAMNLAALGATPEAFGIVGADDAGGALLEALSGAGIGVDGVLRNPGQRTVAKTRFVVADEGRSPQQVLRVDREPEAGPDEGVVAALVERVRSVAGAHDAVILSDYGYGVVSPDVAAVAVAGGRLVAADSRWRLDAVGPVRVVTPNHVEAAHLLGRPVSSDGDAIDAVAALRERLGAGAVVLTRGNRGMVVLDDGGEPIVIPATGDEAEVSDVSGAGDTVIATVAATLAAGASVVEAAHLANCAAAVVVRKPGAATCTPAELLREVARAV